VPTTTTKKFIAAAALLVTGAVFAGASTHLAAGLVVTNPTGDAITASSFSGAGGRFTGGTSGADADGVITKASGQGIALRATGGTNSNWVGIFDNTLSTRTTGGGGLQVSATSTLSGVVSQAFGTGRGGLFASTGGAAIQLQPRAGTPTSTSEGDLWVDSSTHQLKVNLNGAVATVGATTSTTSGNSGGGPLANLPLVPDPRDDEFNTGTTPTSSWSFLTGRVSVGAINPYSSFTTSLNYATDFNTVKPGWFRIQGAGDGAPNCIQKTITLGTNDAVWTHVNLSNNINGTEGFVFYLMTGLNTFTDHIRIDYGQVVNYGWRVNSTGGSGSTTIGTSVVLAGTARSPVFNYMLIQKIGTTYHTWLAMEGGNWSYLRSDTIAATLGAVALCGNNTAAGSPGQAIASFDFVRFVANATGTPF
jgi:hypothetical protein